MTDTTFLDLVDQLTRERHEYIQTDDGLKLVTSNGLLESLREAVFGGASGGGGAQGKAKLPLDAAALDILEEIDRQAAEALAQADPRPTPYGHTEEYVRLWAALVDSATPVTVTVRETVAEHIEMGGRPRVFDAKVETTAYAIVSGWVSRAEAYFNPPLIMPIPAPCPGCDQRYVYRMTDGVTIRSDALTMHLDRETRTLTGASCGACGKRWDPHDIPRLAVSCGFEPGADVIAAFVRDTPMDATCNP